MKFEEVVGKLLIIGTQVAVIGLRYERFTEPLAVKPEPLSVTAPPVGPEVGETPSEVPKLKVRGLPNPVTKS
jgi:hypothetical protein